MVVSALALSFATTAHAAVTPVKHVVIIYQENHSFDNLMGQFCAANPDRDCAGPTIGDQVTLADGAVVTIAAEKDIVPQVGHQPNEQDWAAANEWDKIPGCLPTQQYGCIVGVAASQVPNLYMAAAQGAIATDMTQPTDAASWAAHFELVTGGEGDGFVGGNPSTNDGGCRVQTTAPWRATPKSPLQYVPTCIPDYSISPASFPVGWPSSDGGAFEATPVQHIPNLLSDRLDPAGRSWREYISGAGSNNSIWSICADFASCVFSGDEENVVDSSQLGTDDAAGKLPNVAIVLPEGPAGNTSQHNGTSMTLGDNQIGAYLQALSTGPEWPSTAVFITYDDCGCFYDHLTPPRGDGPRTAFVLVSPWAAHGTSFSTATTTASIPAFIEYNWALAPLGSADAAASNLLGMFNFHQTPNDAPMPTVQTPIPHSSLAFLRAHPVGEIHDNT
jgi:phospholipase C